MKFSHQQFEIHRQPSYSNSGEPSFPELNINNISRNNNTQMPSSKVKLNCFLTDSFNEVNFEVDKKITLGTLKKKIIEVANLNSQKKFNILYNDKDFTNFNKLRLVDIIEPDNSRMSHTEPSGFNTIKLKIVPTDLDESILSTDSKFKQMLECNLHPRENAHFFCLNCNLSFCALCIDKHLTHDFLDKYDFSKSKQEIVKTILRNMLAMIKEKKKKESFNVISEKILNAEKKFEFFEEFDLKGKNVVENIKLIWANYEQYSNEYKNIINNLIEKKVNDFNQNLLKFKMICINNLSEAQKSTDESDIITLDNDYFQSFNQTLKELNIGRDALMNYLDVRNSECDYIINEILKFDDEIMTDLKNVLNKIQNKNIFFKELYLKNEENVDNEKEKKEEEKEEEKDNKNDNNENKNEDNLNNNNDIDNFDDIDNNMNIDELKKNNGFFENQEDINNLNNIDKTNQNNYINNGDINNNNNNIILDDNNNNGIYNSLEVSLLSNQDEVNVHQYIDATFDANVNEHEILVNESPEKLNNDNINNNNDFILNEQNNLINKDNNNDNNITDIKMIKSASSCGFNENIEEYGEGGNSLIRKINNLNKKEFNTYQGSGNEKKDNLNNNKNISITGKIFLNKNNSTDKIYFNSKTHNKYIMKRKLLKEIYIYNIKERRLESIKDFKKDANVFKRFLQFSIYLNAKNNLYISGGKTKEEQISNSFYCYNYDQNSLTVLPDMLNPRCSHSMIYINNNIISDELFIIGGHGINTGERYSFRTQKWKLLPSLHTKERQVSTLICVDDYLYTLFGFVNGKKNNYILGEKLNLNKLEKWEMINFKFYGIDENKLNKFNVGLIKLSNYSYLLLGGEINSGGETDDVFKLDFNNNDEIVISETNLKLPCPASFIDKNFIPLDQKKFAQFDMKKSNFIFYDALTNKFGMKPMMKKK